MARDDDSNGSSQPENYVEDYGYDDEIDGASELGDSGESTNDEAIGYLDLEAFEKESESESNTTDCAASFFKFTSLPQELQNMIWKFHCPSLNPKPRVIQLSFSRRGPHGPTIGAQTCSLIEAQPMLALLAVHRASRSLGHSNWPHSIQLEACQVIPYHRERDIILCSWPATSYFPGYATTSALNKAASGLRNLALEGPDCTSTYPLKIEIEAYKWLSHLPALRNVYVLNEITSDLPAKALSWIGSDTACQHDTNIEENYEDSFYSLIHTVHSWPDPEKHFESEFCERTFGALQLPEVPDEDDLAPEAWNYPFSDSGLSIVWRWAKCMLELRQTLRSHGKTAAKDSDIDLEGNLDTLQDPECKYSNADSIKNVRVWPMAYFYTQDQLERFAAMKLWRGSWDAWISSEGEDGESVEDGYESDGTYDTSLSGFIATDEEDDMPAHILHTSSQFSASNVLSAAQFSSDSEVSNHDDGGSGSSLPDEHAQSVRYGLVSSRRDVHTESGEESGTEVGPTPSSSRRQYIVLDDNDVEQKYETIARQPARNAKRRVRPTAISSDDEAGDGPQPSVMPATESRGSRAIAFESDEDEDVASQSIRNRPRRVRVAALVESHDEYEEVGDDKKLPTPSRTATRPRRAAQSSESDDESEDSYDEELVPAPRPSLAQRLAMEYQQPHPQGQGTIDFDDEDESDAEGYGGAFDDDEDGDAFDRDEPALEMAGEVEDDDEDGDEVIW